MDKSLTNLQGGLYGVTEFAFMKDLGVVFKRVEFGEPVGREATLRHPERNIDSSVKVPFSGRVGT